MLSPYRVLDCTDERGHLAGLLLAQLGAEVILVEPPEGSAARRRSPRAAAGVDPERGLWHWAYNRGKRSVVLDLASPSGREGLLRLAAGADVLLWSGRPGELSVTYEELAAANPALVVAALTPWGLDGPKADWPDADLVLCASACHLSFTGNRDLAPLRWGSPQAYLHGAADLAVAALLALTERVRSGRGQLADVSAQVSNLQVSFCYSLNQAWSSPLMGRSGEGLNMGNYRLRWTYPAADGEVSITFAFGAAFAEFTGNLFRWIWEEGGCDEATRDKPWADLALLLFSGEEPASEVDRLADVVAAFTATRTKAELFAEAARRRVLLAPIATLHEVLANPHLAARRFWDHVPGPDGAGQHRMPGRFVVSSEAPLAELGAAPALGADTASVLAAPVRTPAGLARA
ncbi:MAG: CoA transferase, partial [Acidimicrobiales bacterium]